VDPPAPVASVTVIHPVTGARSEPLPGKLDSGADTTVIPHWLAAELRLSPRGHTWTRAFDGSLSRRAAYYVRMRVQGFDLPIVRCIAAERDTLLLGRNVLNHFRVVLDGGSLTFDLSAVR
jgi:hypothetical protein